MLKKVITALEQLETQGSFAARETTGSEDLQIEINPIGRLRFPLKPAVAKKLIQVARPAPFGWRDKTCLDTEVRNTWKIPKSRVKIDKRLWNKTLIPTLNKLKDKLGLPEQERLKPELHDVLIYGPGQFFAPHQDSEKCDGMIATLVVVLPSTHSGGGLIIEHQGGEKRFQSSRTALDKLSFFAFYADCQHEVRPITAGYRIALIYNLVLQGDKKGIASALPPQAQQGVTSTLEAYFATPPTRESEHSRRFSNKIVYLLDHQYTPKGVSWKALKGADQLRASALLEAATALNLEIHLALADVRELWECEEEEPYWGYGARRRRWSYDDDEEDDDDDDEVSDVELLDLIDETLIIKYWRDQQGKSIALPEWHPNGAEICWTRENSELDPFESNHEGWMGNYGNTMERWYHRAAIILWSREERYSALLEIDPETMIRELLGLADKKSTHPQSQEIVRQLLPNWSGLRGVGAEIKPSSFNRLFRLAHRLDSPELARGLLLPLSPDALSPKTARAMIRLQSVYGTEWLIDIIQSWLDTPAYPQWGHLIDGIAPIIQCWVEHAPDGHGELTHWLLLRQLKTLKEKHRYQIETESPVFLTDNAPSRINEISDLLSASLLSRNDTTFAKSITHLIADMSGYPLHDLIEIARFVKPQDRQTGAMKKDCTLLLDAVRKKLTMVLKVPPRRANDWSITVQNNCGCADCEELQTFLQSSGLNSKVWPLAKMRRQHIHQKIGAMGIPVTHKTERSGSPHKLHLTKTKQLFLQDREQRTQWKKALDDLTE